MFAEPAAWKRLMTKLVTVQADYLAAQARAGAQALQVFDSWAGIALGLTDYRRFALPYTAMLLERLKDVGVPVINFSTGTSYYIDEVARAGGDVIGVDWRRPLDEAWKAIGYERAIQGNLDPAALLAPWRELRYQIDDVLDRAAGRPGHIFNARSRRVAGNAGRQRPPAGRLRARAKSDRAMIRRPIGLLVMAYGGPQSLDDLPGYLADIRRGRPTPRAILDAIARNYRSVGGTSPLLAITRRQVAALAERLGTHRFECYLGMRHWAPWIEDTVARMVDDGVTHAVSLVLAPHYSRMSVGAYQQRIAEGLDMAHGDIEFVHVASYHDAPGYIEALVRRVRDGITIWPEPERERVHVVFSAHSLPASIVAAGDVYDAQCQDTARRVAAGVGLARWPLVVELPIRRAQPGAVARAGARGSPRNLSQAPACVMC